MILIFAKNRMEDPSILLLALSNDYLIVRAIMRLTMRMLLTVPLARSMCWASGVRDQPGKFSLLWSLNSTIKKLKNQLLFTKPLTWLAGDPQALRASMPTPKSEKQYIPLCEQAGEALKTRMLSSECCRVRDCGNCHWCHPGCGFAGQGVELLPGQSVQLRRLQRLHSAVWPLWAQFCGVWLHDLAGRHCFCRDAANLVHQHRSVWLSGSWKLRSSFSVVYISLHIMQQVGTLSTRIDTCKKTLAWASACMIFTLQIANNQCP